MLVLMPKEIVGTQQIFETPHLLYYDQCCKSLVQVCNLHIKCDEMDEPVNTIVIISPIYAMDYYFMTVTA